MHIAKLLFSSLILICTYSFAIARQWKEKDIIPPLSELSIQQEQFGYSVAIDGNYAVVGSPAYDKSSGRATVLHYNDKEWKIVAYLTASDKEDKDNFGLAVDISGNTIVIGSDKKLHGNAYVFTMPESGWTDTTETAILKPSDKIKSYDFGCSVSISGNTIAVGASMDDAYSYYKGCVYVYTKPETGWKNSTETAKLTASDGKAQDCFGKSVCISQNNTIVVGASDDDDNDSNSGSAYVFEMPQTGWVDCTETAKLLPSDGTRLDYFGNSVDIYQNTIVVGAPGAGSEYRFPISGYVYVFTKSESGWTNSTETAKLSVSDTCESAELGNRVNIYKNMIVAGAYQDKENGHSSGSVYVYTMPESGWINNTETAKITASDGKTKDYFGHSVAMYENNILVGAKITNKSISSTGVVYSFQKRKR